jgi:signal transduction histidine kinase
LSVKQGTNVEIRIPRSLPAVKCDRVQISEVFTNLISNAIRYNDSEQKWVEIGYLDPLVESSQRYDSGEQPDVPEPTITFYVRDNGIGISERHLDIIFRIFKRLHSPRKYGGGTGAGLTIAKKMLSGMGETCGWSRLQARVAHSISHSRPESYLTGFIKSSIKRPFVIIHHQSAAWKNQNY